MILPSEPVSGVANCHAEGVYSFVLDDDRRIFACLNWTTIAANEYGDAVGFHDHHRDVNIKVLSGEIKNTELSVRNPLPHDFISSDLLPSSEEHPYRFNPWCWDSSLRGGKGKFSPDDETRLIAKNSVLSMVLTPSSSNLYIPKNIFHTISQLTKVAIWMVTEEGPSTGQNTTTWSREDLFNWHRRNIQWYSPIQGKEMLSVWNIVRSAVAK